MYVYISINILTFFMILLINFYIQISYEILTFTNFLLKFIINIQNCDKIKKNVIE